MRSLEEESPCKTDCPVAGSVRFSLPAWAAVAAALDVHLDVDSLADMIVMAVAGSMNCVYYHAYSGRMAALRGQTGCVHEADAEEAVAPHWHPVKTAFLSLRVAEGENTPDEPMGEEQLRLVIKPMEALVAHLEVVVEAKTCCCILAVEEFLVRSY